MTNGEKLIEIFPNNTHITLKRTTQFVINPMTLNQQMIVVDNDFWNAEYEEPTTKNNLGVDCISRQAVIDELKRYFHDEYYQRTSIQDCRDCFIEDVLNYLSSVTPQEPRWIPVSERLPDIHNYSEHYLVTLKNGEVHRAMCTEMNGEHWWNYNLDDVIAWMPLPQPYREVKK